MSAMAAVAGVRPPPAYGESLDQWARPFRSAHGGGATPLCQPEVRHPPDCPGTAVEGVAVITPDAVKHACLGPLRGRPGGTDVQD